MLSNIGAVHNKPPLTCELVLLSEHASVQLFPVLTHRVSLQGNLSKALKTPLQAHRRRIEVKL